VPACRRCCKARHPAGLWLLEQVGLNVTVGNPITSCRVSGKFAFIELRSPEEAANALSVEKYF